MKKLLTFSFIIALITISIISCKNDSTTVTPPAPSLKGVYVLYSSASAGGSDYAYVDIPSGNVTNNLYQNANGGAALDYNAGDIRIINNQNLIIVCGGQSGQQGKIYSINSANQHLNAVKNFGSTPCDFAISSDRIYVSSRGGSYLTEFDLSLNFLNDYIDVGLNPGKMIYTVGRFIVCRSVFSPEYSIAAVNTVDNNVIKTMLPFKPVSIVNNLNGYFVSGYDNKKIFMLDSVSMMPVDSFAIPTADTLLGNIVKVGQNILLVVAGGQNVWELNLGNVPPSTRLLIPSRGGSYGITGIAYEELDGEVYIADNQGGSPNLGKIWRFKASDGSFVRSYDLIGRSPVGMAFKY